MLLLMPWPITAARLRGSLLSKRPCQSHGSLRQDDTRTGTAEAGAEHQLANAPTITAQAIRLDDDIKLLRSKLVSKLRPQTPQPKTMLERFER
jgi:hypothetical protein